MPPRRRDAPLFRATSLAGRPSAALGCPRLPWATSWNLSSRTVPSSDVFGRPHTAWPCPRHVVTTRTSATGVPHFSRHFLHLCCACVCVCLSVCLLSPLWHGSHGTAAWRLPGLLSRAKARKAQGARSPAMRVGCRAGWVDQSRGWGCLDALTRLAVRDGTVRRDAQWAKTLSMF